MITQIEIENFKCFKNRVSFPLGKLTLLTGVNGRGKSTLLQSLLLMKQSIEHNQGTSQIVLNGSCVNLGSLDDIHTSQVNPVIFKYHYDFKDNLNISEGYIEYFLAAKLEDEMIAQVAQFILLSKSGVEEDNIPNESSHNRLLHNIERVYSLAKDRNDLFEHKNQGRTIVTTLNNLVPTRFTDFNPRYIDPSQYSSPFEKCLNLNHIHYVSADRIGPKDFYTKSTLDKFPNVGARGEFTANLLYKKQGDLVDDRLCLGEDAKTLITQTEAWLSKIFGGAKLEIPKSQSSILELLFNTSASKDRFKPANVGFGFHSVLPIIVSGLIATEDEILIVENPEIHLHPRAQSELTKFLAKVSSRGVQVLIESHSDHILNGLQVAVVDKIIGENEISVLYFQSDNQEPVVQIPIQKNGRIDVWPDGFFDQSNKDLEKIFGI